MTSLILPSQTAIQNTDKNQREDHGNAEKNRTDTQDGLISIQGLAGNQINMKINRASHEPWERTDRVGEEKKKKANDQGRPGMEKREGRKGGREEGKS